VPSARDRLRALIEKRFPRSRVEVVHDTRLVLAAAGLDAGVALIAGTGSVAYALSGDGLEARRGGWGWMVGDEGSGVWIAREAAGLVTRRVDDGVDLGALGAALLAACDAAEAPAMIAKLHAMHEPMAWAALATAVFETADVDAGSRDIIVRAASALADLVLPLLRVVDGPVVLAGGLLLHQPRLEEAVRKHIETRCIRLEQPPVEGAVRLAEGLLATPNPRRSLRVRGLPR
jgi:N-acetylglucosamine kinase-like BadF-type ATPase